MSHSSRAPLKKNYIPLRAREIPVSETEVTEKSARNLPPRSFTKSIAVPVFAIGRGTAARGRCIVIDVLARVVSARATSSSSSRRHERACSLARSSARSRSRARFTTVKFRHRLLREQTRASTQPSATTLAARRPPSQRRRNAVPRKRSCATRPS